MNATTEIETRLGAGFHRTRDVSFERGVGAELWDSTGRRYLDCSAAYGTASLGHAHPAITRALTEQAQRLMACTPSFGNGTRAAYLTELREHLPPGLGRIFLCNSGTEAVEAALKVARISTGRTGIIACVRGFHGRTLGALSATWEKKYKQPFAPLVPGFSHVPYNDLERLAAEITEETAAVVLEVVQGEGGVRPASADYLRGAQALCRERGALLIIDEVQTGFGRTGRMFAVEHFGIEPDLMCLAKGIAAGFPMGALAIGERIGALPPGSHGSTFGGSPLACAVGLATLQTLRDENLVERAAELGAWLQSELEAFAATCDKVRAVRGLGLMVGIELREPAGPYLAGLFERGIIALPAGPQVIRFLPPLVIAKNQLQEALTQLGAVLGGHEQAPSPS